MLFGDYLGCVYPNGGILVLIVSTHLLPLLLLAHSGSPILCFANQNVCREVLSL
jgi:hypothetical protein